METSDKRALTRNADGQSDADAPPKNYNVGRKARRTTRVGDPRDILFRYAQPRTCVLSLALVILAAVELAGCSSRESRAQSFYESGEKLLAEHNSRIAAVQFHNAVALKKDMLPAWRGLAEAEEQNQQWEGLASALRTIVELDPKDDATKLKLARLLLAAGAVEPSLKIANQISDPQASSVNVLALKAGIFYKLKDDEQSARYAQAAIKLDPHNINAVSVLAALRLSDKDPKGALQVLADHSADQSQDLGIELLRLQIYQQLKDDGQLEHLLKTLVQQRPQDIAFQRELVALYAKEGRNQDAENALRTIAASDPKDSQRTLDLVRFLYRAKGAGAARQELTDRINAAQGDVLTLQLALADLDFEQGKPDDSFALLQKLSQSAVPADAAKAKVKMAQLYIRQKNIQAAETIANDIINKDSHNSDALRIRGAIHLDRGEAEPAINDFRQALNEQPGTPDLMLLLAAAYDRNGSVDLADKEYTEAVKSSKFNVGVALSYVAFLRRHGRLDRAYDFMGDLLDHQPNSIPALATYAQLKIAKQDWAGAEEIAATIKRLGNNDVVADEIKGVALSGQQKFDESIAALESAVTAAPRAARPLFDLVATMVKAQQTDRAMSFLSSVLKDNPKNAEAHVLLGDLLVLQNNPDKAESEYRAAMASQPGNELGYRALATLYLHKQRYDAAIEIVRDGLKQAPNDVVLHMSMAAILEAKGDFEGAITEYRGSLRLSPDSPIIANNLASLLADHRADKASLDEARSLTARLRNSTVPQFRDTVGWVDYRLEDLNSAVPLLEDAAAKMPKVALVHYHLGMAYLGQGEEKKAAEQFGQALQQQPSAELQARITSAMKNTSVH